MLGGRGARRRCRRIAVVLVAQVLWMGAEVFGGYPECAQAFREARRTVNGLDAVGAGLARGSHEFFVVRMVGER